MTGGISQTRRAKTYSSVSSVSLSKMPAGSVDIKLPFNSLSYIIINVSVHQSGQPRDWAQRGVKAGRERQKRGGNAWSLGEAASQVGESRKLVKNALRQRRNLVVAQTPSHQEGARATEDESERKQTRPRFLRRVVDEASRLTVW